MPPTNPAVPVVSASGVHLELADGRRVIDAMSSWWAAIHGYRHPVLDEAIKSQLADMSHVMFGGLTHGPAVELSELLAEISPPGLDHVFLADSGSVAVEVAIKMALQHQRGTGRPERHRLLTVRGGYHGDTFGAMSVCDPVNGMHSMFSEVLAPQLFAPVPEPAFGTEFRPEHAAEFTRIIEAHTDEIAGVILEPIVQGAGGMRFYAPGFLREVRRLCDVHDVVLIADEIATGFGRSGELFACDHAGVSPDIMCLGKAMTGGYLTMSAVLCNGRVAEGVSAAESGALMHGPTFMANPLAAAVSAASVELLTSSPWRSRIAEIAVRLTTGLAPAAGLEGVAEVRVLGAIGVIELTEPVDMASAQQLSLDAGVWLRPFGKLLYTMPPFITTDEQLDAITESMVHIAENARRAT